MKKIINLFNFEFERISKFLLPLMIILAISQLIGVIVEARRYVNRITQLAQQANTSREMIVFTEGTFSIHNISNTYWFTAPIFLCICGLLLYSLFTWYREWFGQNTFAYRLMMLPMNRMAFFFSKLFAILLATFCLLVTQLVLFFIGQFVLSIVVPNEWLFTTGIVDMVAGSDLLYFILPTNTQLFFLFYTFGLIFLIVLFTAIIIERSYQRFTGLLFSSCYGFLVIFLMVLTLSINSWFPFRFEFYRSEAVLLTIALGIIIGVGSLFTSNYFINRKLSV